MDYSPSRIASLLERLSRLIQASGHSEGLKPAQWDALRFFSRANRFSRTPSALTAYLGVTKGTVSQTIKTLEARGLVEKVTSKTDRRSVSLSCTADGLGLLEDDPLSLLEAALEMLPKTLRSDLGEATEFVLVDLLTRREGRPFGICRMCRHFDGSNPEGSPYFCKLLQLPIEAEESGKICVEQEEAA